MNQSLKEAYELGRVITNLRLQIAKLEDMQKELLRRGEIERSEPDLELAGSSGFFRGGGRLIP